MRISLTIFALSALCFGQNAFAQAAPKEVVVVDGQIAVNSMPEVMLQGATNPVPVVATAAPKGQVYQGRVEGPLVDNGIFTVSIPIPHNEKLFKLTYLGVSIESGIVETADIGCFADFSYNNAALRMKHWFEMHSIQTSSPITLPFGSIQFANEPSASGITVTCSVYRDPDFPVPHQPAELWVSYSGYLVDKPAP